MAITGLRKGFLILLLAVAGGGTVLWAQLPASAVVSASPASEVDAGAVRLLVGRSTVLDVGTTITRVSLTSADIADALVTSPSQLLINGKMPGAISMFVWDRGGALKRYEVIVQRDLARLTEQIRTLFPGEKIEVSSSGKNVVLSGLVTNKDIIEKAVNVAAGYVDKKEEVVALLQLQAGAPSNQVLLRVRFAEVSRSALTELGASIFTSPTGINNTIGRVTTQQFSAPGFENLEWTKESGDFGAPVTSAKGQFTFSDFLNVFLFNQKYDIGAMVRLLQSRGMFQSLAEPNLVSESGKEASFLAGGEFPIPIAQGSGANIGVSVVFKEFGIRLTFTPTVIGDRVHLKVRPEVSTLDFANAVTLGGFRIPGADDTADRNRARAAERPDIRDRRPDEQLRHVNPFQGAGYRGHSDSGAPVQEQGRAEAADRAHRDDHAADSAQQLERRDSGTCRGSRSPSCRRRRSRKCCQSHRRRSAVPVLRLTRGPVSAPVASGGAKTAGPSATSAAAAVAALTPSAAPHGRTGCAGARRARRIGGLIGQAAVESAGPEGHRAGSSPGRGTEQGGGPGVRARQRGRGPADGRAAHPGSEKR